MPARQQYANVSGYVYATLLNFDIFISFVVQYHIGKRGQCKKYWQNSFTKKGALDNISFFDYKTNLIDSIKIEYNFDKAIQIIKNDRNFSIRLSDNKMKAFAHVLFNKGFLTGENNCFGGALEYVDRARLHK